MSAELLINVTSRETRVAVIEEGTLQEVHIEREANRGIVGNIYKGRVNRVLPGMQAAFIDIGLDKAAFLHANDIHGNLENKQDISELVYQGQDIVVQVVKDPIGTKGARLTSDITLASRYLVFMPATAHVGVSQRIANAAERDRLKDLVTSFCKGTTSGFIVRTVAEGASSEEITQDALFLQRVWQKVVKRRKRTKTRCKLYGEVGIARRILRDFCLQEFSKIQVDSKTYYLIIKEFAEEFMPEIVPNINYFASEQAIFDSYGIDAQIQEILERKVTLKSGGYLIIDQTEALTTIDINTGGFVGKKNLEETIFNTNLEAAKAIAWQLRLRNLGGIIIIDFIDMNQFDHQQKVVAALEQALAKDRVKTKVYGFTQLGLVEMTRKRTRESLEHVLCEACPTCSARGSVKTVVTVCFEIVRELERLASSYKAKQFVIYANYAIAAAFEKNDAALLNEIQALLDKPVRLQIEHSYIREHFDVVMM